MSLLPSDKYLAHMLGLTDEQFEYFKAEVRKQNAAAPEPAVVAGIETLAAIGISLLVGIGTTIVANLLKPKPPQVDNRQRKQSTIKATTTGGEQVTQNQRVAPRYGFNSTQEIATLGSVIPIVYANRETIDGTTYGGVRANCALLWSQLYSLGGSQMLRGVFMVGEGPMASIDPKNFASGGNTLTSYDFGNATANEVGSRMTVYGRYAETDSTTLFKRIKPSDQIYGRDAAEDVGNLDNKTSGNTDVFGVQVADQATQYFCASQRPANQVDFGLYGFCGNDLGFRPNPTFEPKVRPQLVPYEKDGETKVKCIEDEAKWAQREKVKAIYTTRSGITSQDLSSIGGETKYSLYPSSDKDTIFSQDARDLVNLSKWSIDDIEFEPTAPGVKFLTQKAGSDEEQELEFEYDESNFDNAVSSLESRFNAQVIKVAIGTTVIVTWGNDYPTVINPDNVGTAKDIAWICVKTTFNASGLKDQTNGSYQLLKSGKFKVRIKNELTADDPEDDITVKTNHRIAVKTKSTGKVTGKKADVSASKDYVSVVTSVDGDGNTTTTSVLKDFSVNSSGGGITVDTSNDNPEYKFEKGSPTFKEATGGLYYVQFFSIKDIYTETCEDIASSIAGRQKTWDDSIIVGELYKIGTGLAVCTSRTAAPFTSEADLSSGSGTQVDATFKTVRTGVVSTNTSAQMQKDGDEWLKTQTPARNTATTDGHVMRCAIASFSTSRPCKAVEIGLKSTMGININGLTSFNTTKGFEYCDNKACLDYKGNILAEGASLYSNNHVSNTINTRVERYSFFKVSYREAGSTDDFTLITNPNDSSDYVLGVRSSTSQTVFNYFQLVMPSIKQWEFQVEPLSGYEIRNHTTSGLFVLEAGLPLTVLSGTVGIYANGEAVPRTAQQFAISQGKRSDSKDSLGIPYSDATYPDGDYSLIDTWGKLAETFIFEEVTSSATGPEHSVTYLNEITPNVDSDGANFGPVYGRLALLGVNIASSVEWQQFAQFSAYVTGGKTCRQLLSSDAVGATHLFPDIVRDLMTNKTYGRGDLINDEMIKDGTFKEAAQWCQDRRYFYDGAVADQVNLRQWTADVAAMHLLNFIEVDGKFVLRTAMPCSGSNLQVEADITGLYTAGNIKEGSFKLQYLAPEDREPIQVSVRYREERASTDLSNPGMFPVVREMLIREAGYGSDIERETLDMSDFCTNRQHAIDAAKYMIRMRRIPTHTIQFTTTHEGILSDTAPADYIRVAMDNTEYDELNNGIVTADGALISTQPMSGSVPAFIWDGTEGTPPSTGTITVSGDGKTATPKGVVFTVNNSSSQVRTYQINSIKPSEDGLFTIDAVHMPTTVAGILEIADGFDIASNWEIEG